MDNGSPFKPELQGRIMLNIRRHERRVLVFKAVGFGALSAASVSLLVVAYFNLMSALAQSGFLNFISLFFSDFSSAMANFQDMVFSMVESFPVFSAAFLVGGVIAVIWSSAHLLDDITMIREQSLELRA